MGRSPSSCLKIIACGSNAADHDDIEAPAEVKEVGDKRGWSFRKRSARHRVLSNSVISEAPASGNKETQQTASIDFQAPANPTVPEKVITQPVVVDEKHHIPPIVDSKASETVVNIQNGSNSSIIVDANVAVVIQSAVRGFLAQRRLVQLKSIIKLQAAIRGYLVRAHAVETLYCIQGIAKVQTLVRARRAKLLFQDNKVSDIQPVKSHSYVEQLLKNRFAQQLLESTPKPRSMNIICDPSVPNSGWIWLERWMSLSSSELTELQEQELSSDLEEQKQLENISYQLEAEIPSELHSKSINLESSVFESVELVETDKNSAEIDTDKIVEADERPGNSDVSHYESKEEDIKMMGNLNIQPDLSTNLQSTSNQDEPAVVVEQPKRSAKRLASELLDTEGNKFVYGSRKASNPSFIAAQSKFAELSSVASSAKLPSESRHDVGSQHDVEFESNVDAASSVTEIVAKTSEPSTAGPHDQGITIGGSECGTELSVTSTLDSPDRAEVEVADVEQEIKSIEERAHDPNSIGSSDVEGIEIPTVSGSGLPSLVQQECNGYSADLVAIEDSPQAPHEPVSEPASSVNVEQIDTEPDSKTEQQLGRDETNLQGGLQSKPEGAYKSSPEASPKSHVTVPESQGTPASQASVKAKRSKIDKSVPNRKRSSLSAGKRSPSNLNDDSGMRSSVEHLPNDQKSAKRRNSFGSTKSDHADQEPRESSSSSSLPSYMQATESAKAKAHSPRSSPDVQTKEVYTKKRHSLPAAVGRQESPRVQRSISQTPQVAKGNGSQERKWLR